jgi:hypothetical protein
MGASKKGVSSNQLHRTLIHGTTPADLTVTGFAKALPYSWAEQKQSIGLSP